MKILRRWRQKRAENESADSCMAHSTRTAISLKGEVVNIEGQVFHLTILYANFHGRALLLCCPHCIFMAPKKTAITQPSCDAVDGQSVSMLCS